MKRYARAAGSSNGFTLVEVIAASVVLASAAVAVMAIYVRALEQAAASRDVAVATSVARNALCESLAGVVESSESVMLPDRPSLAVKTTWIFPEDESALCEDFRADVFAVESNTRVVYFQTKRALYVGAEGAAEEGDGDDE